MVTDCKPCAYRGQSLIRHTEGVLKYVEKIIDNGYHETVSGRLRVLGIGTSPEEIKQSIMIAGVFHDVGKAIEAYQVNYEDDCTPIEGRASGFYLHEVFSAVYLKRVFDSLGEKSDLTHLTVLAVLDHLHAMGRTFDNFKEAFTFDVTYLSGEHREIRDKFIHLIKTGGYIKREYLSNLSDYISRRTGIETYHVHEALAEKISFEEVVELMKSISNFEEDSTRRKKLKGYVLILLPILIGDNLDASESRRSDESTSSRTQFIEELKSALGGEV